MRLTQTQQLITKSTVERVLGTVSRVWLFGSRADDTLRGGDIDLLIETDVVLPNRAKVLCKLHGALTFALGDRKLDILHQRCAHPRCTYIRHRQTHRSNTLSLAYLPEHTENALLALELAKKEVTHLAYGAM